MNLLKAPSLQSLLESDRGSNDSLLADSLQLDIEEVKLTRPLFCWLDHTTGNITFISISWMTMSILYQLLK